jgi:uncharacterized protein YndB with AHSA1/START domain
VALEVAGEVIVEKPIEEVFALFSDLEQSHYYSAPVLERTKITDGPVGAGTRYRARDKWPGREVEFTVEITRYSPPSELAATWSTPMQGGWRAEFREATPGTKLSFTASMIPSGLMALLTPVLRPWAKRQTRAFLADFKSWAESR